MKVWIVWDVLDEYRPGLVAVCATQDRAEACVLAENPRHPGDYSIEEVDVLA